VIAARFHNTIIEASVQAVMDAQHTNGTRKVVLSGGSFQNRYLLSGITKNLQAIGLQVLTNIQVPVNDGGIALGQLAVAAARRGKKVELLNC
jgi:hydrogenase maturation protein HypF